MTEFDSIDSARQDFSRKQEEIQSHFEWLLQGERPYPVRTIYAPQLEEVVSTITNLEFPREISREKTQRLIDSIEKVRALFASLVDDLEFLTAFKGVMEELSEFTKIIHADIVSLLSSDLGTWIDKPDSEEEEHPVVLVIQDNIDRISHAVNQKQDISDDLDFSNLQDQIKHSFRAINEFTSTLGDTGEDTILGYLATIVTNIRSKAVHMHIQTLRNAMLIPELLGFYYESLEDSDRNKANKVFELTDSMMNLKKELPMMGVQAGDIVYNHGTIQPFGKIPNQFCAQEFVLWLHKISEAMLTRLMEKNRLLLDTTNPDVAAVMFLKGLLVGAFLEYTTLLDDHDFSGVFTEEHRRTTNQIVLQVEALENADLNEILSQDLLKSATGVDPQLALSHLEGQLRDLISLIDRMIAVSPLAKDVIYEYLGSSYGLEFSKSDSLEEVVGSLKNAIAESSG